MSLNLEFNKLSVSSANVLTNNNNVECKVPLTEEEGKNILNVDVITYLLSAECGDKEVRYSGRAVFTILYKSEGVIKKCESGVEYSYKFPCEMVNSGMKILGEVCIETPSINYLNGIVSLSSVITFKGEHSLLNEVNYFEKDKNLFTKRCEVEYTKELSLFEKDCKIEEEFDSDELVSNVLIHQEKVCVSGVACTVGSVIVDGEVEVCILIQAINKNNPITIVKKIPFRQEVEVDDVIPNNLASVCARVKGSSLKIYVDENKNKSSISLEISLTFFGKLFDTCTFAPCIDAYSLQREVKLDFESVKLNKINGFKSFDFHIDSELSTKNDENSRLICLLSDKIEEIEYKNSEISGAVSFEILYGGEEFSTQKVLVPISFALPLNGNGVTFLNTTVTDCSINNYDGKSILSFKVKVSYLDKEDFVVKVVSNLEEGAEKVVNDSAISVYIPKQGDCLWEVSKVLGVSEEEILTINKDLTFPLNGDERIVVYREVDIQKNQG